MNNKLCIDPSTPERNPKKKVCTPAVCARMCSNAHSTNNGQCPEEKSAFMKKRSPEICTSSPWHLILLGISHVIEVPSDREDFTHAKSRGFRHVFHPMIRYLPSLRLVRATHLSWKSTVVRPSRPAEAVLDEGPFGEETKRYTQNSGGVAGRGGFITFFMIAVIK